MELGVYTFGDNSVNPETGKMYPSERSVQNLLERVKLADEVGLGFFGVGEHHRPDFPISSPSVILGAAAAITKNIRIGSSVTVLSTEDPVRVFQQFAELSLISLGRADITVGRGSFIESYPLFGDSIGEYEELFEEKLELLLKLNRENPITWSGKFRNSLDKAGVFPRPFEDREIPIWVGTGGTPASSARAGRLGQNAIYAIIGGFPMQFKPLVDLYRETAANSGHDVEKLKVGIAGFGLVGEDGKATKELFYPYWHQTMSQIAAERGFAPPNPSSYQMQANHPGAFLVGSVSEVKDRLHELREGLGLSRYILQMDLGNLDHMAVMKSIELLGTEIAPELAD